MKCLRLFQSVFVYFFILNGLILYSGCAGNSQKNVREVSQNVVNDDKKSAESVSVFPAPKVEGSILTLHYNAWGKLFLADEKGTPVKTWPIPFSNLLNNANMKESEWIAPLGIFKVFRRNNRCISICNEELQCADICMDEKAKSAVFSMNYDGNSIFLADESGVRIGNDNMRPLHLIIQKDDLSKKNQIKLLNGFSVYKIKGSEQISWCIDGSNICYVGCISCTIVGGVPRDCCVKSPDYLGRCN